MQQHLSLIHTPPQAREFGWEGAPGKAISYPLREVYPCNWSGEFYFKAEEMRNFLKNYLGIV